MAKSRNSTRMLKLNRTSGVVRKVTLYSGGYERIDSGGGNVEHRYSISAGGALIALFLSHYLDFSPGASIILTLGALFSIAWLFGPRHGILARKMQSPSTV